MKTKIKYKLRLLLERSEYGLTQDDFGNLRAKIRGKQPIVGRVDLGHRTIYIKKPEKNINTPQDEKRWQQIVQNIKNYAKDALDFSVSTNDPEVGLVETIIRRILKESDDEYALIEICDSL